MPRPRRSIVAGILLIFVVALILSPATAESFHEELAEYDDTSGASTYSQTGISYSGTTFQFKNIYVEDITALKTLYYIGIRVPGNPSALQTGVTEFTYTLGGATKTGRVHVDREKNLVGTVVNTQFIVFFDEWDIGSLQGAQTIVLSTNLWTHGSAYGSRLETGDAILYPFAYRDTTRASPPFTFTCAHSSAREWYNGIEIEDVYNNDVRVTINREYYGKFFASQLAITNTDGGTLYNSYDTETKTVYVQKTSGLNINLTSPSTTYEYFVGDPGTSTGNYSVTVYVQNSQTGAAIANSRVVIDALVDGDYYPVVNRTEPSGIFSVTLQPSGGGSPNPDGYRLIASADGYINQMPEINFTVDEYITSIYCSLDPIAGGPLDENKTFIDFFVRDMSANPITGATINFGGYTMITNSAGYAVLEVNKNATYTYTVSKSGYGSLTGNVVIGADPRHTINTVLAPAITPTKTTPIPTSTSISPTPTMTAPTGEPVSNWLDWFAAHFGMILGGGVEIGKIFMWLCFSVPVGVYVAKEAKSGAAGFMAGAGVVTLFFVLIGWVPIWLLVLLALIIGLLYSKAFNNSDNGGGR